MSANTFSDNMEINGKQWTPAAPQQRGWKVNAYGRHTDLLPEPRKLIFSNNAPNHCGLFQTHNHDVQKMYTLTM